MERKQTRHKADSICLSMVLSHGSFVAKRMLSFTSGREKDEDQTRPAIVHHMISIRHCVWVSWWKLEVGDGQKENIAHFYCAGLRMYIWLCHTIHLVWSQEPGQHCTYSGSFWSTLFYTVLTVAMSDLALWTLRNPETAQFFECLILQVKGSLGLPRNKRTVVPLFTFYLKL